MKKIETIKAGQKTILVTGMYSDSHYHCADVLRDFTVETVKEITIKLSNMEDLGEDYFIPYDIHTIAYMVIKGFISIPEYGDAFVNIHYGDPYIAENTEHKELLDAIAELKPLI